MMDSRNTLVSIGLPIFNGSPRMRRAIDSLLAQSYSNLELIISDNASEDNTREISEAYAQQDKRVKYFRQDRNVGMVPNFYDSVTQKATGGYFMWASDDDWWHPDFISTLKKVLDEQEEYGVAMGSIRLIFEDGEAFDEVRFVGPHDVCALTHGQLFNELIAGQSGLRLFIYGLFRMEIIRKLMWQPTPIVFGPDKILMSEATLFTRFYSMPQILLERTIHRKPESERWDGDEYKKALTSPRAYITAISTWLKRLYQSPNISRIHKFELLPSKTALLIWTYRKHILRELWPGGFKFLKKIIKYR